METEKKIPFYAKRRFGEKMSATFDFVRQNSKVLLKWITYIFLPISFLQALSLNSIMNSFSDLNFGYTTNSANNILYNYSFITLCMIVGSLLFVSLIYALMRLYNERSEGLKDVTWKDISPYFMKNMKRCAFVYFIIFIFWTVLTLICGIMGSRSLGVMLALIIFLFIFAIPFSLMIPVYLFEKIDIIQAFAKSFRMGFSTWGGTFALLFIMSLIIYLMQGVLGLPFSVIWGLKLIFSQETSSTFFISPAYTLISFISSVILTFGLYLTMTLSYVALAYQYAHGTEITENLTVADDIDNFETLK